MIIYKNTTAPAENAEADVRTAVQAVWRGVADWLRPGEVATVAWSVMSTPYIDMDTENAVTQHTSVMAEVKGVTK